MSELIKSLCLMSVDQRGTYTEIPNFKTITTVRQAHPNAKFLLYPVQSASKHVGERLTELGQFAESQSVKPDLPTN